MVAMSVLMVVPAAPALAESAARALGAAPERRLEIARLEAPRGLFLDGGFAAVPLGAGRTSPESLAMIAARESESYVVRGIVDAADIERLSYEFAEGPTRLFADPQIGLFPTCGGDPALGTSADVRGLLGVGTLQGSGLSGTGVAVAVVDTGINLAHLRDRGLSPRLDGHITWSPVPNVRPGQHPVDHGTMCAFDVLISAPQSTLLDFPVLRSSRRGGSLMDGVLSDALQAYSVLLSMMVTAEDVRPYRSLVVSNSWGMFHPSWDFPPGNPGRYADNPNHPFNIIVGSLAGAGADIVFAAGNCGADCPDQRCQGNVAGTITGANSHPDVLCVAGVDTTGERVGYSSRGPGALSPEKPDLAAYTHFLGSQAFGRSEPDSGTSAACPVAAGVLAALRTRTPPSALSPSALSSALRGTARQPAGLGAGWNADYGHGIISPLDAARTVATS
jgi:subtilisin family serine protease